MVNDLFQTFNPLFQFDFLVFLEKEIGIGESRPDDLFVALADYGRVTGQGIVHCHKIWQKRACLIDHRKIFLMSHHRCDEDFPWQFEIFPGIAAADGIGIFDEERHGIQKFRIGQGFTAYAGCSLADLL